jgi:alpha-mannosidase
VSGIPALGAGVPELTSEASVSKTDIGAVLLENECISIRFEPNGTICSAFDNRVGRELVPVGKAWNLFQLHTDFPSQWDARDVESGYRHTVEDLRDLDDFEIIRFENKSGVAVTRSFGNFKMTQRITMSASSSDINISITVDWHESDRFLKFAFFVCPAHRSRSE